VLASASRVRQYHSTAVLLPDGRVMTGGGGVCAVCIETSGISRRTSNTSPRHTSTRKTAVVSARRGRSSPRHRPESASVPASQSPPLRRRASERLRWSVSATVTHGVNQSQGYVPLKFSASGTTLTVTGPPNGGVAPPGYYMLFIVDASRRAVYCKDCSGRQGSEPGDEPGQERHRPMLDVPSAATAIRTYLQAHTCNNTKAQALTRLPNDSTIRVLGNCFDVPSRNFVKGQKVWTYTCNNTIAQTWQFRSDGTIRPIGKTTLCLAAASSASNAAILINDV